MSSVWTSPKWAVEIARILDLAGFEVFVSPVESGENKTAVSERVRAYIADRWSDEFENLKEVLNLKVRPRGKKKKFSISHCQTRAAIAVANEPIGIDVEEIFRVKSDVVNRMSSESEVEEAPTPAHLWVAKESYYKALPTNLQPQVISEIEIFNWRLNGEFQTFNARIKSNSKTIGRGLTTEGDGLIFAIATV